MYELYYHGAESANPRTIDLIATRYFVSSEASRDNLLMDGVSRENIFITDSTEVDAVRMVAERIRKDDALNTKLAADFSFIDPNKRLILVTGHRHESHDAHLESLCRALKRLAVRADVQVVVPVHPDSSVNEVMGEICADFPNIALIQPQGYLHSVYLMLAAYFIVTDPGNTPKEALSLSKPVLEMPDMSGRPETGAINPVELDADRIPAGMHHASGRPLLLHAPFPLFAPPMATGTPASASRRHCYDKAASSNAMAQGIMRAFQMQERF